MLKQDVPKMIEKEDPGFTATLRNSQGEGVSKEATSTALAHKFKLNRPAAATTIFVQQLTADGTRPNCSHKRASDSSTHVRGTPPKRLANR